MRPYRILLPTLFLSFCFSLSPARAQGESSYFGISGRSDLGVNVFEYGRLTRLRGGKAYLLGGTIIRLEKRVFVGINVGLRQYHGHRFRAFYGAGINASYSNEEVVYAGGDIHSGSGPLTNSSGSTVHYYNGFYGALYPEAGITYQFSNRVSATAFGRYHLISSRHNNAAYYGVSLQFKS